MCGIAGFYSFVSGRPVEQRQKIVRRMTDSIAHRGPDGEHSWIDQNGGVALGHRRLAIIDLSNAGLQPMQSQSGRYVITFNGEIYNFQTLRRQLEESGVSFHGRSDTEVLLSSIEIWGINATLQKINGMFAFALWDKQEKVLSFARDRFGKKPLYIGWCGKDLVFSSELKAFHQHPDFVPSINDIGFEIYKQYGYIHAPHTIFQNVWQLQPGSQLSVDVDQVSNGSDLSQEIIFYWSLKTIAEEGFKNRLNKSDDDFIVELETKLQSAVSERMISDVPLGAFLSGGIDSSIVVAMMQQQSLNPIKTFTIGFMEQEYNEAVYARDVADYLGTDHQEFYVDPKQAMDVIPTLSDMYDEPFADSSQIPTYLVSAMARDHVTVVLTGDGGDEILAGYDRHVKVAPLWNKVQYLPYPMRKIFFALMSCIPAGMYGVLSKNRYFSARVKRTLKLFQERDIKALYDALLSMMGGEKHDHILYDQWPDKLDALHYMLYGDMVVYRPYDLMVKADRATMATSLEARAPLMDHKLAEYSWALPSHVKVRDGQGKWLLRQILNKYLPQELYNRPKMGFSVPLDQWLKGDLKEWAEDLLDESVLITNGYENAVDIRDQWAHFISNQSVQEVPKHLWSVLMFQAWNKRWIKGS